MAARLICTVLLCFGAASAQSFDGIYEGRSDDEAYRLQIKQTAQGRVTGYVEADGDRMPIEGQVRDGVITGTIRLDDDETGRFEIRRSGAGLFMRVVDEDGDLVDEAQFERVGTATPPQPAAPPAPPKPASAPAPPAPAGAVRDPSFGFQFIAPDGWLTRRGPEGYLLGHNAIPGMILLLPHDMSTMEQVRAQMRQGLVEESAQLLPADPIRALGPNRAGVALKGTIQGQPARAYAVGVLSERGGGVFILSGTSADAYGDQYQRFAEQMAASMSFFAPERTPEADMWDKRLRGMLLVYMKSGSSGGASGLSTWSDRREIALCSDGSFGSKGSFQGAFDAPGGFGHIRDAPGAAGGTWSIGSGGGQSVLELKRQDGSVQRYTLTANGTQTMLDGVRWFVVENKYCQ